MLAVIELNWFLLSYVNLVQLDGTYRMCVHIINDHWYWDKWCWRQQTENTNILALFSALCHCVGVESYLFKVFKAYGVSRYSGVLIYWTTSWFHRYISHFGIVVFLLVHISLVPKSLFVTSLIAMSAWPILTTFNWYTASFTHRSIFRYSLPFRYPMGNLY